MSKPRSARSGPHYLAAIVTGLWLLGPYRACASQDRESIRQIVATMWDSLSTLSFTAIESYEPYLGADGKPDPNNLPETIEFAMARGGKRSMLTTSGDKIVSQFCQDGRKTHTTHYLDRGKSERHINFIDVKGQNDTHDHYQGTMTSHLWAFTPGGRPIHKHLEDSGCTLGPISSADGQVLYLLKSRHKGRPLRCELDPAHDYLPRKVVLGMEEAPVLVVEVSEFSSHAGRFFPSRGTKLFSPAPGPGRPVFRGDFRAVKVSINEPIPDSQFNAAHVPDGVIVGDRTTGRGRVQGGIEGRKRYLAEHLGQDRVTPSRAIEEDTNRFTWPLVLGTASIVLLSLATVIWSMRRLSKRPRAL